MGSSREHKNLKNRIRIALGERNDVLVHNNEGGFDPVHKIRYGLGKGSGDLLIEVAINVTIEHETDCTVARSGYLEIKTGNATQDKDQKQWARKVRSYGGFYAVVHSVEEALDAVKRCRKGEYE